MRWWVLSGWAVALAGLYASGLVGCFPQPEVPDCVDEDGDGFGAEGFYNGGCPGTAFDCDDGDATVHPGAEELCDGLDNDCNGFPGVNESDDDLDGYSECDGDCDDGDGGVYPGAPAECDGVEDNDCDGNDDGNEGDGDGDGFSVCEGDCDDADDTLDPADVDLDGFSSCEGDCDDADGAVYPGAAEGCDGLDTDCDGTIPADEVDGDGDGFPVCLGDCDDTNAGISPATAEQGNDGIDQDCDGDDLGACTVLVLGDVADMVTVAGEYYVVNQLTAEIWIRPAQTLGPGSPQEVILAGGDPAYLTWALAYEDGQLSFTYMNLQVPFATAFDAVTLSQDTWYHVAGVRNGDTLRLYLDGVERGTDMKVMPGMAQVHQVQVGTSFLGAVDEAHVSVVAKYGPYNAPFTPAGYIGVGALTRMALHLDEGVGIPVDEGPQAGVVTVEGTPTWEADCLGAP